MPKKLFYDEVKNTIENLGYELISNEYKGKRINLVIKDKYNFLYYSKFDRLKLGHIPDKFNKSNPYTIQNIKLWCKLNEKPFELISDVYNGTHNKLKWKCLKEDCKKEFESSWHQIIQGATCNFCNEKYKKYTTEEVTTFLNLKNFTLVDEIYLGINNKITLKDEYGFIYFTTFNRIKNNFIPEKFHISNPYTTQNIKLWLTLNNKDFILISDTYINSTEKLKWKCLKEHCEEIFEMDWNEIISGCNCSYCRGMKVGLSNCLATKNPELAKEWHPVKNGKLTPYDVTCGLDKELWWQCKKDKSHVWSASIGNRNRGEDCPFCLGRKINLSNCLATKNSELSMEWHESKNSNLTPYDVAPFSKTKVWWRCNKCGNEWESIIYNRSRGTGCPKCNESKGEKRISEFLNNNNFIKITQEEYDKFIIFDKLKKEYYITQKEFINLFGIKNGLLSYDFYLPDYNLLIEYQGKQHEHYIEGFHKSKKDFEKQLEHDRRKKEYTNKHNIKLLQIWYWDFDNIEKILENELFNNLKDVIYI